MVDCVAGGEAISVKVFAAETSSVRAVIVLGRCPWPVVGGDPANDAISEEAFAASPASVEATIVRTGGDCRW